MPRKSLAICKKNKITIQQLLRKHDYTETLASKTILNHIKRMRKFFDYAITRNYTTCQIFYKLDFKAESVGYDVYTNEELTKIFSWENYKKFCSKKRSSHYWVALLALYHGFRLGEILFLKPEVVQCSENGIWYIDIVTDKQKTRVVKSKQQQNNPKQRQVKTISSLRKVPVHNKILELGFLDFVEDIRNKKGLTAFLFEEYVMINGAQHFSALYSMYRDKLFDTNPRSKTFHSFRHQFSTAVLQHTAMRNSALHSKLIGHKTGNITIDLYSKSFLLNDLNEIVNLVNFDFATYTIPHYRDAFK